MAFRAPIDHVNAFKYAMSQQNPAPKGEQSIDPLSTTDAAPIGSAPQIKMKVKPSPIKGTIRHSLSKMALR